MSTTAIIGFGDLGRQILALLPAEVRECGLIVFDDQAHARRHADSHPFSSYLDDRFASCNFYVGLGYHHLPRKVAILDELRLAGRRLPALVHPSCYVDPTARIAEGCVLYPGCTVDQLVELQPGVLLSNSVTLAHGSRIGAGAYLAPGVVVSGRVTIGAAAFLGTGALVSNDRTIGNRARVGIGTVVTRDVPEEASVIGSPMRLLEKPLNLD